MPGHTSREILVIFSSLTTCDPSNIYDIIKVCDVSYVIVIYIHNTYNTEKSAVCTDPNGLETKNNIVPKLFYVTF